MERIYLKGLISDIQRYLISLIKDEKIFSNLAHIKLLLVAFI